MRKINNRKSIVVVTPQSSGTQLITAADMRSFLRQDSTADDTLLNDFVKTATESIARFLRRTVVSAEYKLIMDRFGDAFALADGLAPGVYDLPMSFGIGGQNVIELPYAPIVAITHIKTYDATNTSATLASAAYTLDVDGRVYLNSGYSWPSSLRDYNAVEIQYTAGYGYTNVPLPIKAAIRDYAAAMYDCRKVCEMPATIIDNLSPYRILDDSGFM